MSTKEQQLLNRISEVRQLSSLSTAYNEKDKEEVLTILDENTKKSHPVFEKYTINDTIPKEVAIAFAISPHTTDRIIDLLINSNIDDIKVHSMKRKNLNHDNCYDLLTKSTNSDFEKAFENPEDGIEVHNAIKKNIIDNAIADIRIGRKLKKYQVSAFSCTDDKALLKKIFLAQSVPEDVIAAIINNPHLSDDDFVNKCFDLGCDYRKLNLTTPYILEDVYRTAAEAVCEIKADTKEENIAQKDSMEILTRLIKDDKLTDSQRNDLYERINKMPQSDKNRSTLLKGLIITERSNQRLVDIICSTSLNIYKRLACLNLNCTSDKKQSYIHTEIESFCERLPTSISSYNFLSSVIQNTQLNLADYMSLINKHLAHTTNEKLADVVRNIAHSKATPIKILEVLSDVSEYPDIKMMATINLACKENISQKGDFENLLDICLYKKDINSDFKYNPRIEKILRSILNATKDVWIANVVCETVHKFEKLEKEGYSNKLSDKDFSEKENQLLKRILNECGNSLFTFYRNIDMYAEDYDKLLQLKEIEKDKEMEEER